MYQHVDPALIVQLRDLTAMPLSVCRKALLENDGDINRSREAIREQCRRTAFVLDGDRPFFSGTKHVYSWYQPEVPLEDRLKIGDRVRPIRGDRVEEVTWVSSEGQFFRWGGHEFVERTAAWVKVEDKNEPQVSE
jgi:hypothetical protein